MQIKMMPITEIHPYEKNPRFNDGAVEAVANSIKEFGFQQPIVVDGGDRGKTTLLSLNGVLWKNLLGIF